MKREKRSIIKAYVTFKSMAAVNLVNNAYNRYSTIYRYFIYLMSYCCCSENYNKIRTRQI